MCDEFNEGDVNLLQPFSLDTQSKVRYNPYTEPTFVDESGNTVEKADWVRFDLIHGKPCLTMAKLGW